MSALATRLAILSSHPIQYNAPAFRSLAEMPDLDVHVFYGWEGTGVAQDPEFGRAVAWDVPLLDGYQHTFVPNKSRHPGSHRFLGIDSPMLPHLISRWNPDALLVYGWAFASHLRTMRSLRGKVPILFRGDSTLLDEGGRLRTAARRLLLRWVYSNVDVAFYPGKRNREYLRVHGMQDAQLVWAPHAVDNKRFAASARVRETEAQDWRKRLGVSPGDTVFLFSAKLVSRKDPATLLRAFVELRSSLPDHGAHLVFVGDGELSGQLQAAAAGRSDVHFLGFQNQTMMPVVYSAADVVVLPSLFGETWGLAINEAMACGRPVIVSDKVGCAVDLVQSGQTGFIFEHGDVVSLQRAMSNFLSDKVAAEMGAKAYRLIQDWSVEAYAQTVAKKTVLLSAIGNNG